MKYVRITAKHYALAAVILLLPKAAWADQAELAVNVDTSFYSKYPYIRFIYTGDPTKMSDEQFYAVAARVGFAINQTEPSTPMSPGLRGSLRCGTSSTACFL